jgi:hypothetical protein
MGESWKRCRNKGLEHFSQAVQFPTQVLSVGFETRSATLPGSLWRILDRGREDQREPRLSGTAHEAENSYLEDREKKALGLTA